MVRKLIVISDLHISAGVLDDFDGELESHFVRFLEDDLACRPYAVELVINGDFLDFVQAPPYGGRNLEGQTEDKVPFCSTQAQSREKLAAIHSAHLPTFRALRRFLEANPGNAFVVLPGNHDADFFWPGVRRDFIGFVCDKDTELLKRIRIHLERAYQPSACRDVWIEHGQQYDPVNSFFIADRERWSEENPPIVSDGNQDRLYACLGTRFLIDYLNELDAEYPFVDNVKPFSRFVRLFLISAADFRFGPLKAAVAGWRILEYLSKLAVTHPKDLLGVEKIEQNGKKDLLARLEEVARDNGTMFQRINQAYPGERAVSLLLSDASERDGVLEWLSEHLDMLEGTSAAKQGNLLSIDKSNDGYLSLAKGFGLNETALLVDGAIQLLDAKNQAGIKLVVMGHTHEPVAKPEGLNYYNTGSWTRYYRFNGDDHPSSWSILRDKSYESFPYRLNYVDIDIQQACAAKMICYKEQNHD